jgi:DNA-binding response OmpR family regulator
MAQARILLIDDDRIILEMLNLALSKADFDVVSAVDGELGLQMFREHLPSLVIVDIAMPGIDGYQVIEQIREADRQKERKTPVIVLTAHEQSVMRAYADELGADLYLTKPVTPRQLVDHIHALLGRQVAGNSPEAAQ